MSATIDRILALAVTEARKIGATAVEPVHLLVATCKLETGTASAALESEGVDPVSLRRRARGRAVAEARRQPAQGEGGPHRVSRRVHAILEAAQKRAAAAQRSIESADVLAAVLARPDAALADFYEWEPVPVRRLLDRLDGRPAVPPPLVPSSTPRPGAAPPAAGEPPPASAIPTLGPRPGPAPAHPDTPMLDSLGRDLTALARAGKLGPVIGRQRELRRLIRILLRKESNNPVLVGDPGVGKTAIVEALARCAVGEEAPPEIQGLRIVEIVVSALLAGAGFAGELERRVQAVIQEAGRDPHLVLFIDELHVIAGAGGPRGSASDLGQMLKPVLARGTLRVIGATTPAEYGQHIEKDAALERRFSPVAIEEPSREETREILRGIRAGLESHHKLAIADEAIDAAIDLSVRYLPDRRLPDKARTLLDQAATIARVKSTGVAADCPLAAAAVGRREVALAVSEWTRIPIERVGADERKRLLDLEQTLGRRVIGQEHAISAVARVVRTAFADLARRGRPHGVFLFLGPTGVGKTELAKALAEALFDDERAIVRIDMSEHMEMHSVARLIGAPPGYLGHDEGGQLVNAIRRRPYSVVLLDEIEKAHPRVLDLFLQVFDEGRLTDSHGRVADFSSSLIIMTSNLGGPADRPRQGIGFGREAEERRGEELHGLLRPELVNRIGEIVRFRPLGPPEIRRIIDKILDGVRERIAGRQVDLEVAADGYEALAEAGYRPEHGAREMERVIERWIVQPLADLLLAGTLAPGAKLRVARAPGGVRLEPEAP